MKLVEPRTLSGFMELEPSSQLLFEKYKNIIESTYQKYSFTPKPYQYVLPLNNKIHLKL